MSGISYRPSKTPRNEIRPFRAAAGIGSRSGGGCVLAWRNGAEADRDGEEFLSPFLQLDVTARVSRTGSRIRRQLRKQGAMIGDFDILIGATALEVGADLVTADPDHYARIPSLAVAGYRE
jgi:predicted nucleic acid-binding protein